MRKDIIDPDSSNGFKNEKFFSIAILVLIIMAIGGFAILRSDAELNLSFLRGEVTFEEEVENLEEETAKEDEEEKDEEAETEANQEDEEDEENLAHYEEGNNDGVFYEETSRREYAGSSYKIEAEHGDGLTHVARKAMNEHGASEDLTAEQKVFVEDYIQRRVNHDTGWLEVGETIEISEELIDEAVQRANELTEDQLQNLSQYTLST